MDVIFFSVFKVLVHIEEKKQPINLIYSHVAAFYQPSPNFSLVLQPP